MNAAAQSDQPNETAPIESQTTTALAIVTQSITEINAFETGIAELEHQYKGVVFEVGTTAGMDEACKARLAIRKPRYAIQKLAKEAKATLNELKDGVDEQAEGYITRITAIEDPVHEQIENEQKRKAAEKETKRLAEQARVDAIQERINEIRESVMLAAGKSSADIQEMIAALVALPIDASFAEYQQRAETAKEATLARLRAAHNNAVAIEAAQKRLAEERAELSDGKHWPRKSRDWPPRKPLRRHTSASRVRRGRPRSLALPTNARNSSANRKRCDSRRRPWQGPPIRWKRLRPRMCDRQ